jgi:predicted 3-demethylubiquinone-9 3-methyltransferase (glyoxalase superfamily)
MTTQITPFLMFEGQAETALRFYVSLFEDAEIETLDLYPEDDPATAGLVRHARFRLQDQSFQCIDSPVKHDFAFNASVSIHVTCDNAADTKRIFDALGVDGTVMMPLGEYPFSPLFGWVSDRFGLSWQLTVKPDAA